MAQPLALELLADQRLVPLCSRHDMNFAKILFLDYDGVLHPDEVYLTKRGPVLRTDGELFMWAPLLTDLLDDFPSVRVVLSTSWVRRLGFRRALSFLPIAIQARVIGATWHSQMSKGLAGESGWDSRTRYGQIARYVARSQLSSWLAIDDDSLGWPPEAETHLLRCDPAHGISQRGLLDELDRKLKEM